MSLTGRSRFALIDGEAADRITRLPTGFSLMLSITCGGVAC